MNIHEHLQNVYKSLFLVHPKPTVSVTDLNYLVFYDFLVFSSIIILVYFMLLLLLILD